MGLALDELYTERPEAVFSGLSWRGWPVPALHGKALVEIVVIVACS